MATDNQSTTESEPLAFKGSITYVYNGNEVSASSIDFSNENICEAFGFAGDDKHYIFNNEDEMAAWAANLDVDKRDRLLRMVEDRKALEQIAINTDALAYSETHNGNAPQEYTTQADAYWLKRYGVRISQRTAGFIWDYCISYGDVFPIYPGGIAYYPDAIRKKMSHIEAIGIHGALFCSKSFYFGKKYYFNPIVNVFGYCLNGHWFNNLNVSSFTSPF